MSEVAQSLENISAPTAKAKYNAYPAYRDSRIEWLGEVPDGWEVLPIKFIVEIPVTDGPHETPEFLNNGIPFVSAEACSSGKIDFEKIRGFISAEDHLRFSKKYRPKLGDVYLIKSGATTGISAIVEDDREFNIWSPLAVIRCNKANNPYFVLNFLRSRQFQDAISMYWSFGTQQNIGMNVIENIYITKPPISDQQSIANFLDNKTAQIDALIERKQRLIEFLKEKRTALISQAVTIDDAIKNRMEAESAAYRKMMREWYQSTAFTRLEPGGAIVIVMSRWREDDLVGFVLKEQADEGWVVVNMPALNDNGEALWPERYPVDQLLRIKAAISSYDWQSMYQQAPTSREGNILKREWWRFYDQLPPNMDVMIQSWDMNFKEGAANSFVVGQVWGRKGPNCYLIHQYRGQIGFTDTLRQFENLCRLYPSAYRRLVENKANGPAVIDVLKRKFSGIIPVEPEGSKEARVHAISAVIETGNVFLPNPKNHPWVEDFVEECACFPSGHFSDQVDAMSQGLSNLGEQYDGVARLERLLAD